MRKINYKRLPSFFALICLLQFYTAFRFVTTVTTTSTPTSTSTTANGYHRDSLLLNHVPVPSNKKSARPSSFITLDYYSNNVYPRIVHWFPQEQQFLDASQSNNESSTMIFRTQQQQQPQDDLASNVTLPDRQRRLVEPMMGPCYPNCRARKITEEQDRLHHPNLSHYVEDCQPMADWQMQVHPTCNALHETLSIALFSQTTEQGHYSLSSMKINMIDEGGTRTVWEVSNTFLDERVILKLFHYHLEMSSGFGYQTTRFWAEPSGFWMNEVESMALDKLTSSPGIVNIYAHCGQSQLSELATDFLPEAVDHGTIFKDPWMRLGMAVDIAWALSAIHSIDFANATNPTLAHGDLHNYNVVAVDGKWKLLDFNRAIPMKWNVDKDAPCGFQNIGGDVRWRAPETFAQFGHADPAQADMYSMGGILFYLLTSYEPWRLLEPGGKPDRKLLSQGKREGTMVEPHVPQEYLNTSDPSQQVLYEATMDCFRFRPEDRPTSYQLALRLQQAYDRIVVVRVTNNETIR